MQDWSKMGMKWKQIRDLKNVPKGAGGRGISIGDAIKPVAAAQSKSLKLFVQELKRFDEKLAAYKTAILKNPKDPKYKNNKALADWIDDNLAVWVKDDKQLAEKEIPLLTAAIEAIDLATWKMITPAGLNKALTDAAHESATAQGKDTTDNLPLVPADAARIEAVFAGVTKGLTKVNGICAKAKIVYGANSKEPIAAAFVALGKKAKWFQDEVNKSLEKQTWTGVANHLKVLGNHSQSWQISDLTAIDKAVRTRIGQ
jgi:hypothetical protein